MTRDRRENRKNITIRADGENEDTRINPGDSVPVPTPKEKKEFEDGFDEAIVRGIEKKSTKNVRFYLKHLHK